MYIYLYCLRLTSIDCILMIYDEDYSLTFIKFNEKRVPFESNRIIKMNDDEVRMLNLYNNNSSSSECYQLYIVIPTYSTET